MCCARLPNRLVDVAREHQQSAYGAPTPDDVSDRWNYIVVVDHDARVCGGGQPTPDRSGPPLEILAHHPVGMATPVPDRRFDRSGWPALSVGRRILPDEHYICRHEGGGFHDAIGLLRPWACLDRMMHRQLLCDSILHLPYSRRQWR